MSNKTTDTNISWSRRRLTKRQLSTEAAAEAAAAASNTITEDGSMSSFSSSSLFCLCRPHLVDTTRLSSNSEAESNSKSTIFLGCIGSFLKLKPTKNPTQKSQEGGFKGPFSKSHKKCLKVPFKKYKENAMLYRL